MLSYSGYEIIHFLKQNDFLKIIIPDNSKELFSKTELYIKKKVLIQNKF